MPKPWVVSLLAVALVPSGGLRADPPQAPVQGARIRVQAAGKTSEGTLAGQDTVSLRLQVERLAEPLVVPRATVTKLYVSEGRAKGKAAMIGAAIGFAVAGALAVAAGTSCSGECLCSGSGCMVLVPILGIPAAATGAGIGALVAPERWREIPVGGAGYGFSPAAGTSHLRLGLAPIRGGAAASVACSF